MKQFEITVTDLATKGIVVVTLNASRKNDALISVMDKYDGPAHGANGLHFSAKESFGPRTKGA